MRHLFFSLLCLFLCMSAYMQSQVIASPRIYYHEEKLLGDPIETKFINPETFDFILQHAQLKPYKNPERNKMILLDGEFGFVDIDQFKYSVIRKDGISYTTDEGSFYLPKAIIFMDVSDHNPYPSEFYFVASIKDQLELCRCSGGEEIKWYQLPDRYTVVTDSATIEKANHTMEVLRDFIAYEMEQEKEAEEEKMKQVANRQPISAKKKAAYTTLTEICIANNPKKKEILSLIDELKEYNDDEEYGDTYDYFRLYMNHQHVPFIISVDWKEAVEELNGWVSAAVKENLNKSFQFNSEGKYEEDSTVSDDGLFAAFDYQLGKIGLRLTMIETDSDEYQLIIHPVHDREKVLEAMADIGIISQPIPN